MASRTATDGLRPLEGRVCLVTGASRGLGKGIALQLGQAGATVYITGRTLNSKPGTPGSLLETAKEVEGRGGKCHAVQCDHSKDEDIKNLFETIGQQQNGRLDILVNNAYSAVNHIAETVGNKFWQLDLDDWDIVNNVGLRNHYLCSVLAARIMVPRKRGLIVNVSSPGGIGFLFSPSYGIGKMACDRMAVDCAMQLKKDDVAFISLWPGSAKTETFMDLIKDEGIKDADIGLIKRGESTELSGKVITRLANGNKLMSKSGKVHLTLDLAEEYGLKDIDGGLAYNIRSLQYWVAFLGYDGMASWIPRWLKAPKWVLWLQASHL
ncbi:hypothetical protein CAPTEDRAFT_96332 [Capitella teleta]|uniref:Dehydrogenase/reductase SDR family member 1 n=1 Tax=Capitella teleta TaxID=283909 RepID=R7T7C8_CAPTE|nr:hypothetical protein CAPTEDRAFT_96332 [Capitella teleta]|eukprot:ELT87310.1 hypothetical protein CAPTEDRAFT_96332 [Capitella teleta]